MRRLLLLGAWVLALQACEKDPYVMLRLGDGGIPDLYVPGDQGPCTPVEAGGEICDGKDNDCDGMTDEDFNLQTDVNNCGACGNSCLLEGALTECELGKCKYLGCAPGFIDLDSDPKNGCEHPCTGTGAEVCDGKDNDCNGQVDETFNLQNDVKNCGSCGNECQLANAVPKCEAGACKIQSCSAGYIDKDQQDATGCESPCAKTSGGVEICDGVDNDCDGLTDEDFNLQSDPLNCGGCGTVCVIPNAAAACSAGACSFSGCSGGFVDADKDTSNGCECLPEGAETCDGKDNDCNGIADDNLSGYPGVCGTSVGECQQGVLDCKNGVEVCTGKVDPTTELCDGKDTDCNGQLDPAACVFAATGRESRLDMPAIATPGLTNSAQLAVAGEGDQLIAVWLDRRSNRGDIYANLSSDGGKTWDATNDYIVAAETGDKLEPQVSFGGPVGSFDRIYVAYERFESGARTIYVRRSDNGGKAWSGAVMVKKSTAGDALFVRLGVVPGATADKDRVIVCWETISVSGPVSPNVMCNISTNGATSFAANDSQVNSVSGSAIVPDLAVDASYAYVTWQQGGNIWAARSPVSGNSLSFGAAVKLSGGEGQDPRILADGSGRVVVVWEDLRDPLINIRANASTNSGQSWLADGVRVDKDVVNGDSTRPVLAARSGGRILVAWEDTVRGKQDIYTNYSDDGGVTWGAVASRVTAGEAGLYTSQRPSLAVDPAGNNVYAAWEDYRNGAYRDIYFSVSLDNGKTWNEPDYRMNESSPAGAADARTPRVFAATSRAAVLWVDNRMLSGGVHTTGANADIYCSYVE